MRELPRASPPAPKQEITKKLENTKKSVRNKMCQSAGAHAALTCESPPSLSSRIFRLICYVKTFRCADSTGNMRISLQCVARRGFQEELEVILGERDARSMRRFYGSVYGWGCNGYAFCKRALKLWPCFWSLCS